MNRRSTFPFLGAITAGALMLASVLARSEPAPAPAPTGGGKEPPRVVYNQDYLKGPAPVPPVPDWAFTMDPPATADLQRRADDDVPRRVQNSSVVDTRRHALNHNDSIDWHPENHPPAPSIVMFGHKPQPAACAFCHMPNGAGMPENAPLAGLPYHYFVQQVHDFQDKSRRSADMRMASHHGMADIIAPKISDEDLKDAAAYFSSFALKPYLTVVETDVVPKTRSINYTLKPVDGGGSEPIGDRIIETPNDWGRFELEDDEVGYTVYVPRGSIARGEVLAQAGGKAPACASCHGAELKGVGDIPPIAGRSPSNLVRQLHNFKTHARSAPDAAPMWPVAESLSDADMVDVAAYLASRTP